LTTLDARDGRPRSVPICFVVIGDTIYSPLDDKPKAGADPQRLGRVRNLRADPRATILIDRWSEDWGELGFVELRCDGGLLAPGAERHAEAIAALRAKYPQYAEHRLDERPLLRFLPAAVTTWLADDRRSPLGSRTGTS
jgi:PPOX class probable F420-dependent enzyme